MNGIEGVLPAQVCLCGYLLGRVGALAFLDRLAMSPLKCC